MCRHDGKVSIIMFVLAAVLGGERLRLRLRIETSNKLSHLHNMTNGLD